MAFDFSNLLNPEKLLPFEAQALMHSFSFAENMTFERVIECQDFIAKKVKNVAGIGAWELGVKAFSFKPLEEMKEMYMALDPESKYPLDFSGGDARALSAVLASLLFAVNVEYYKRTQGIVSEYLHKKHKDHKQEGIEKPEIEHPLHHASRHRMTGN